MNYLNDVEGALVAKVDAVFVLLVHELARLELQALDPLFLLLLQCPWHSGPCCLRLCGLGHCFPCTRLLLPG